MDNPDAPDEGSVIKNPVVLDPKDVIVIEEDDATRQIMRLESEPAFQGDDGWLLRVYGRQSEETMMIVVDPDEQTIRLVESAA